MSILNELLKYALAFIYPTLLILLFFYLYKHPLYNPIFKGKYKIIIKNTLIVLGVFTIGFLVFFLIEDTIYRFDYAGHWNRIIGLRMNFSNGTDILRYVYDTMNNHEYNALAALFQLLITFINNSYGFFVYGIFIFYYLPSFILLQLLYFKYFKGNQYLPVLISIIFYPLYITIFFGIIDISGFLFLLIAYMILIIPAYKSVRTSDLIIMNLLGFIMIFLRRWYLYPLITIYILFLFNYLRFYKFKVFNKKAMADIFKLLLSGIILLVIILLFFRPYFITVISNDFNIAYQFYDRGGKLINLINYYSITYFIIIIVGFFTLIKEKKYNILSPLIISIVIPLGLFWSVQSMESHHYYMINLVMLGLFTYGLCFIINFVRLYKTFILISAIQLCIVFSPLEQNIPFFTTVRKTPEVLLYKDQILEFVNYIDSIAHNGYFYMPTGNYSLSDDMLKNAKLPNPSKSQFLYGTLDLRDGLPQGIGNAKYIILSDPILYLAEPEYQYMYTVINDAITSVDIFSNIYKPIYIQEFVYKTTNPTKMNYVDLIVYEKIGEFTSEHKQYLYDEMIKKYPDQTEYFSNILE